MDIWQTDKLLLFIAFVIPGFVSIKTYGLFFPNASKPSGDLIVDAIAYSSINYALLLAPIYAIESFNIEQSHPFVYVLFYVFVLLIAPLLWAVVYKSLRTSDFLQRFTPHPMEKPWDFFFSKRTPHWVIVTLKNWQKIAGYYGPESFASSAAEEQLYLQEHWVLNDDGGFLNIRTDTDGILILSNEIMTVEFFACDQTKNDKGEVDDGQAEAN